MKLSRISLLISLFILTSCAVNNNQLTGVISELYGKTFIVKATRADSNSSWYLTSGTYKWTISGDSGADTGTFSIVMNSYLEPQFCAFGSNCTCTGTVSGTFSVAPETTTTTVSSGTYNVFDPYTTSSSTTSSTNSTSQSGVDVKTVYKHQLSFIVGESNLSTGCVSQVSRTIILYRYVSGEVVLVDGYRQMSLIAL